MFTDDQMSDRIQDERHRGAKVVPCVTRGEFLGLSYIPRQGTVSFTKMANVKTSGRSTVALKWLPLHLQGGPGGHRETAGHRSERSPYQRGALHLLQWEECQWRWWVAPRWLGHCKSLLCSVCRRNRMTVFQCHGCKLPFSSLQCLSIFCM